MPSKASSNGAADSFFLTAFKASTKHRVLVAQGGHLFLATLISVNVPTMQATVRYDDNTMGQVAVAHLRPSPDVTGAFPRWWKSFSLHTNLGDAFTVPPRASCSRMISRCVGITRHASTCTRYRILEAHESSQPCLLPSLGVVIHDLGYYVRNWGW